MKKFLSLLFLLVAFTTVGLAQSQCVDVEEIDGSPKAPCIRELKVTNGTLSCPTVNRCTLTISGGGGSGTVTSVSVTTANGVSATCATCTTTPALTFVLGAITPTTVNGLTITSSASGVLTIAAGKTLTASNTLTFTGTDGSSVAFGTGGTVAYVANKLSVFAATTSAELAGVLSDETGGSGLAVFNSTPTIITPSFTTGFTIGGVAATGTIPRGNGTNFVASAFTMAAPGTTGNVLTSDGTNWTSAAPAGGGAALSGITAATGNATIANAANNVTWNWQLTGAESGFTFGETAASTGGGASDQHILQVTTASASTAIPLFVNNIGAGVSFRVDDASGDTTPFVIAADGKVGVGTASPAEALSVTTVTANYGLLHSDGTRQIGTYVDSAGGYLGTKSNNDLLLITNNAGSTNANAILKTTGSVQFRGTSSATTFGSSSVSSQGLSVMNMNNTTGKPFGIEFGGFNGFTHVGIYGVMTDAGGNSAGDLVIAGRATAAGSAFTENWRMSPIGAIAHVPATTTGTGATAGYSLIANSLTTGNALDISSSSVTSGNIAKITSTSTAAASSTLTGLNIAISGANGSTAQTVTGAAISVTNTNATSGTNTALSLTASGATTDNIAISATAGRIVQTSASATAFESGPNGGTNPVFRLVNNTASAATGLSITGNAAGSGVTLQTLSSSTNDFIEIKSKGTSTNSDIKLTAGSGSGLVTITSSGLTTNFGTSGAYGIVTSSIRIDPLILGNGAGGATPGLMFGKNQLVSWSSNANWYGAAADTFIRRSAAANLAFGAADAASPVAQTLSVQNVVAGTTDTAGAAWTFKDSAGTGTGVSGGFAWQTANASGTGSTQNSYTTKLALSSAGAITQTSASATAFESGPNGGTNPVFRLVNSTASAVTGLSITGRAAGAGVDLTVITSSATESLNVVTVGTGSKINHVNVGNVTTQISRTEFKVASNNIVGWTSGFTDATAALDTGFERKAAAHVRINNGSTGAGSLVIGTSTVGSIGTSGVGVLAIANGTAPTSSPADTAQLYTADINGTAGSAGFHIRNEINTAALILPGVRYKTDTGDPTDTYEGMMVINTFDNTFKVYAEGAWRTITTW